MVTMGPQEFHVLNFNQRQKFDKQYKYFKRSFSGLKYGQNHQNKIWDMKTTLFKIKNLNRKVTKHRRVIGQT